MLADQTVRLSPREEELCDLLDEFRSFVARTAPTEPQVECRIAGGWVRDKVRRSRRERPKPCIVRRLTPTLPVLP